MNSLCKLKYYKGEKTRREDKRELLSLSEKIRNHWRSQKDASARAPKAKRDGLNKHHHRKTFCREERVFLKGAKKAN